MSPSCFRRTSTCRQYPVGPPDEMKLSTRTPQKKRPLWGLHATFWRLRGASCRQPCPSLPELRELFRRRIAAHRLGPLLPATATATVHILQYLSPSSSTAVPLASQSVQFSPPRQPGEHGGAPKCDARPLSSAGISSAVVTAQVLAVFGHDHRPQYRRASLVKPEPRPQSPPRPPGAFLDPEQAGLVIRSAGTHTLATKPRGFRSIFGAAVLGPPFILPCTASFGVLAGQPPAASRASLRMFLILAGPLVPGNQSFTPVAQL